MLEGIFSLTYTFRIITSVLGGEKNDELDWNTCGIKSFGNNKCRNYSNSPICPPTTVNTKDNNYMADYYYYYYYLVTKRITWSTNNAIRNRSIITERDRHISFWTILLEKLRVKKKRKKKENDSYILL